MLRLGVATVLGGALGAERELRDHEAGFRTHLLVALGSALFTIVSAYGFEPFLHGDGTTWRVDPTRIAAQIVTGIGFLGAGAIVRDGINVRGLTTAANLWAVAAIGIACGAGYYAAAAIGSALVLIVLWPLRLAADLTLGRWRRNDSRLLLEVQPGAIDAVIEALRLLGREVKRFEVENEGNRRRLIFELDDVDPTVVARLSDVGGVESVGWEP